VAFKQPVIGEWRLSLDTSRVACAPPSLHGVVMFYRRLLLGGPGVVRRPPFVTSGGAL
jgi:hypothetical protein